ncbi:MAG: protein kinase [Candidatus Eisenbacteria bacterium]
MNTDDPEILKRLASTIADREEIDWVDMDVDPSSLRDSLDAIRKISRVAGAFRKRGPEPSSEVPKHTRVSGNPESTEEPVRRWGQLELFELLGKGSYGEVYRAFDPVLERDVALKIWREDATQGALPVARTQRLLAEAKKLAKVRHPGVVVVHGADIHDGVAGIWTEKLEGESIEAKLERGERLIPAEACRIAAEVGAALEAVHATGLVHGDVKDGNVYLEPNGRVVLLDFGSSRDAASSPEAPISVTPLYAAPEVLEGHPPSPKADLYSLGAFLYGLLAGHPPVEAGSLDELVQKHRKLASADATSDATSEGTSERTPEGVAFEQLPDVARSILVRALEVDPAHRYDTAHEMTRALLFAESVLRARSRARTNLPERLSAFFGRDEELESVRKTLQKGRWVTLVGPGGSGKTRLALEAVRPLVGEFQDGVWWLDLTALRSGSGIASHALGAIGLTSGRGNTGDDGFLDALRWRELLLVIDNAEHLVQDTRDFVETVLATAPRVRVLVTSRVSLASDGEVVQRVPPLRSLGDSVRLFEDRATKREANFDLANHKGAVERICRALEGVPLAIEIAAARSAVFSPEEILARLGDLSALSDKRADRPQHRSLRASIEWSYDLLDEQTQWLFAQLSIFLGGWRADAAEQVVDAPSYVVLEGLATLLDHSLIERHVDRTGNARFSMLETVREFASERLTLSGGEPAAAAAHWRWLHGFVEKIHPRLETREQAEALAELKAETANIVRALGWARPEAEQSQDLCVEYCTLLPWLRRFFGPAGRRHEALATIEDAIDTFGGRLPDDVLGRLNLTASRMAIQVDFPSARAFGDVALDLLTRAGDESGRCYALFTLAAVDNADRQFERAEARLMEALAGFERLGDDFGQASVYGRLGHVYYERNGEVRADEFLVKAEELGRRCMGPFDLDGIFILQGSVAWARGQYERARDLFEECVLLARSEGDQATLSLAHFNLGNAQAGCGNAELAKLNWEEGLRIGRESGNDKTMALCSMNLGQLRPPREARAGFVDALEALIRCGDRVNGLMNFRSIAEIDLGLGDPEAAVRLHSAGVSLMESLGVKLRSGFHDKIGHFTKTLETRLPRDAFERNWQIGAALSLEEAIELSRTAPADPAPGGGQPTKGS